MERITLSAGINSLVDHLVFDVNEILGVATDWEVSHEEYTQLDNELERSVKALREVASRLPDFILFPREGECK